jgi:hypothetical protein
MGRPHSLARRKFRRESPGTAGRRRESRSPLEKFYIAHPGTGHRGHDECEQLAKGKNLLLTPGNYELTEPIRVTHPDTVVMGLGFATLRPINGTAALTTADADGIIVAGLLVDAGRSYRRS